MLEPQSTGLFVLLMVVFGGLIWWLLVTRQPVLRLLAACLAFVPAMLFGVVAVNKYYGYYQTWGAALADLTSQGGATGNTAPPPALAAGTADSAAELSTLTRSDTYLRLAQQQGSTLHLMLTGPRSHITRAVYVYLPPEYFQPSYRAYRFPVIELIHGQPGDPQDWINVVGITATLDRLVSQRRAKPAVLVMPDANGAQRISLQCLNQAGVPLILTRGGGHDMTTWRAEVPAMLAWMTPRLAQAAAAAPLAPTPGRPAPPRRPTSGTTGGPGTRRWPRRGPPPRTQVDVLTRQYAETAGRRVSPQGRGG